MNDLFKKKSKGEGDNAHKPLYEQLRPNTLKEIVGQEHIVGQNGILTRMINNNALSSIILWGPPGTGKTTIAKCLAQLNNIHFEAISAVFSGVAELKKTFEEAKMKLKTRNKHCYS